jgi:hypothetical protein
MVAGRPRVAARNQLLSPEIQRQEEVDAKRPLWLDIHRRWNIDGLGVIIGLVVIAPIVAPVAAPIPLTPMVATLIMTDAPIIIVAIGVCRRNQHCACQRRQSDRREDFSADCVSVPGLLFEDIHFGKTFHESVLQ